MREHFGLREAFHGYPLIEVFIMEIGYGLLIMPFVLASLFRRGRRILGRVLGAFRASGCFFGGFEQTEFKTQKIGLYADLHFTFD